MKKSIIVIGLLLAIILCEIAALVGKSKNPSPVAYALDEQEYALPDKNEGIAPFVFENGFVDQVDEDLQKLADEMKSSFGIYSSEIFARLSQEQQRVREEEAERQRKLDEFRQIMMSEPVAVRGSYLGDNQCEVDGVQGVCADGVYKLGKHCIACYDGLCAGATCAEEAQTEEVAESAEVAVETPVEPAESENTLQENLIPDIAAQTEPEDDISQILEATPDRIEQPAEESVEPATNAEAESITAIEETVAVEETVPAAEPKPEAEAVAAPEEEIEAEATEKTVAPKSVTTEPEPVIAANDGKEALVAIVIDDVGLSVPFTNQLADINYPLTVSFLPYGASNKEQVKKLKDAGFEVMLHAPMMPRVPADLAPITLSPKMSKAEIKEKLTKMIERFDGTGMKGVNNHMGSAFTESREAMEAVMEVLHERGMYFLDSKTTSRSVGRFVSKEYDIPYVARDVFLDNERVYDYIMGQFRATERVAKNKGYAIAIGHPYQQTLRALRDWLKESEKRGIKVVPLSDLVAKTN